MEWSNQHFVMTIIQDVKYGVRMLMRNPSFTSVAVITLALGIGVNVAVFSFLETLVLRQLPYSRPAELFAIFPIEPQSGRAMAMTSYPKFLDWQEQSRAFAAMSAFTEATFDLTSAAEPERLNALCSTPGLFALLGIHPVVGREFVDADNQHVVLLGFDLWRKRFSGDPDIVGKSIHLNGTAYTVLGVLPARFFFPPHRWWAGGLAPELFVPVIPNPDRGWNYLRVVGRLAPTMTERQASKDVKEIAARLSQIYPTDRDWTISLERLSAVEVSDIRHTAWLLFGAVNFVFLIACANVANLLLVRGTAREREIAIRGMVGASRFRLMRQLFTESLLLALLGGLFGIGLAYWTLPLLALAVPVSSSFFPHIEGVGVHMDSIVLTFGVLLAAFSILLFGSLPAWKGSMHFQHSVVASRTIRPFGALIAVEVALSFILLTGAGMMLKSVIRLLEVDTGFHPAGLLTLHVDFPDTRYASAKTQTAFVRRLLDELGSQASVTSAAATSDLPMTRAWTQNGFEIPEEQGRKGLANFHSVSPTYFSTMGIPLLEGRTFEMSDSETSRMVGVIGAALAKKYFMNHNPIGMILVIRLPSAVYARDGTTIQFTPHELTIVGVVADVRHVALDAMPLPEIYLPYAQWPSAEISLVIRTHSAPGELIPVAKKAVWRLDSALPVTDVKTMDDLIAAEVAERRFVMRLIGVFASIAVMLAAVGIYGVVFYGVRQRIHDIAVRIALGATRLQILKAVAFRDGKWVVVGIVSGIAGAIGATRFLNHYLYAVQPNDPVVFIVVVSVLSTVGCAAGFIPARRATQVNPVVTLRYP
jgi:putative ABC transport system permease protein